MNGGRREMAGDAIDPPRSVKMLSAAHLFGSSEHAHYALGFGGGRQPLTQEVQSLPSRLIQLVPRFRPDVDGVGECALHLGDALSEGYGIPSDYLVFNLPAPGASLKMPVPFPHTVERLAGGGAASLNRALDRLVAASGARPVLLLHYVSYGYSPHGTPAWLPTAVERFNTVGGRVVVLFHELYAGGRFPSRVFFTSWLQRRIAWSLLAKSEAAFTSSEDILERMQRHNKAHRPTSLIGICSNAGEPENPRPLAKRTRRLAVFGKFSTRKNLYACNLPELLRISRHLGIEEISDIGPVDDAAWMEKNVVGPAGGLVRSYGAIDTGAVSELLEDSILGAVAYRYSLRWKSGVFAAYQAHAMSILLFANDGEMEPRDPADWCFSAERLLALDPSDALERMEQAADAGLEHYRRYRSVHSMAETLLPALRAAAGVGP
jgi:hypothetical protein